MSTILSIVKIFILYSFTLTSLIATTIHVPAAWPTIQGGLNVAYERDTVLVAAGTYYENIIWPAYNGIKLIGSGQEDCIIDGDSSGSVIRFEEDLGDIIDLSTFVSGFTIQHGYYNSPGGGGIFLNNASPNITSVKIINNSTGTQGGGSGIYCYNSNPILTDVIIDNNEAKVGRSTGEGGGIYCYNSNLILMNVTLSGNSATFGGGISCYNSNLILTNVVISGNWGGGYGGGINCRNSVMTLNNVRITGNSAPGQDLDGSGGGIFCFNSELSLTNVTISDNSANEYGGGIYLGTVSNADLTDVTITGNTTFNGGGGIFCYNSDPILTNVTISGNTAWWAGGIYCNDSSPTIVNSILWDNSPEEVYQDDTCSIVIAYSVIEGGLDSIVTNDNDTVYWEDGNIDTYPMFVDPEKGDYTLQDGSPSIDAGTNFFIWEGDTLVDYSPDEYVGSAPDMGAYEFGATVNINNSVFVPQKFVLNQNFPNPFNPITTIHYELPQRSDVQITIYDLIGRKVTTLMNQTQDAGFKSVQWNATNGQGKPVSAGVYLYQIQAGEFVQTKKMVLLK